MVTLLLIEWFQGATSAALEVKPVLLADSWHAPRHRRYAGLMDAREQVPYPEEHRLANLELLLEALGAEPPTELMELVRLRDEEFAADRDHHAA
jgi:hypothetical protein